MSDENPRIACEHSFTPALFARKSCLTAAPHLAARPTRSHLLPFRVRVPSLETSPGLDYVGKPAGFGETKRADYIANDDHNASDVIKPDWDLIGAVEDLQILLEVGYRIAQQTDLPTWKPDAV